MFTKDDAIALARTGWWHDVDPVAVASFQLNEDFLCMDFGDFQGAVEEALGRGVWTHEFAMPEHLIRELNARMAGAEPAREDPIGTLVAVLNRARP
jgi:hypothetical protein